MIEVEMSKDIREFEPKVLGPLTKRQAVCIIIGLAMGGPVGMGMYKFGFNLDISLMAALVLALPAILCGFVKAYGLPFETYFMRYVVGHWRNPSYRKYKTENLFSIWETKKVYTDKNGKPRKMKYTPSKKYRAMK